ncbi:MAG: hypothetical protein ACC649_03705 [Myxococcota bacterium]
MITFTNLFLVGFALDGAISVLDDLARASSDPSTLSVVRAGLALGVLLAALGNFFLLALDPRLPKRILLPLIAFLAWCALGAYPLSPSLDASQTGVLALSGIQLGLAIAALGWIRLRSTTSHWLLHASDLPRKRPRIGYTLRFAFATTLIAPPLLAGIAGLSWSAQVERATAGFVTFDLAGINSTSREYRREDRRIDLVGMAHIGEDRAYLDLFGSFAGESTLILEEGVSDEEGLIGEGLFYETIAKRIGLDVQPSFETLLAEMPANDADTHRPDIRNADVDAREFADDTIEVLDAAARLYQSDRLAPALAQFQARLGELGPEATRAAFRDLIQNRNAHLLGEIRAGLDDYQRIVVPWGALHLPGIEDAILGWGFEQTASSQRRITAYQTILTALLSRDEER